MSPSTNEETELRAALEAAGLSEALTETLAAAGLARVPDQPEALLRFLLEDLQDALVGLLHPTSARELVEKLAERLVRAAAPGDETPTIPPPPSGETPRGYEDLASGAIHTRATPVWGMVRPELREQTLWILVTENPRLLELADAATPPRTEISVASSLAVLRAALDRAQAAILVLDVKRPSLPVDQVLAALTENASPRVLVWGMSAAEHARLGEALPHARTWLCVDAEVSAAEIIQLLGA